MRSLTSERLFWAHVVAAAIVGALSLIGWVGYLGFDAAELTFSFAGAIQAFFVFPGLVLSLLVNGFLIRAHRDAGPSEGEVALLAIEALLIWALIVFHFWNEGFGFAIFAWAAIIVVATTVCIAAIVRNVRLGRPSSPPTPPPAQ